MSTEAMKLALEALENVTKDYVESRQYKHNKAITALRTAIAEAEKQEPVAWMIVGDGKFGEYEPGLHFVFLNNEKYWKNRGYEMVPVYTTPPAAQRPWVWLSEEDEREIKDRCTTVACVLRAVKAKLKGKNT